MDRSERPARLRDAFAAGQFRALFVAHVQSTLGDQLARVALSVLVYDRTGSAAWTALTYAMTIVPNLAGGALLSGVADRYSRRTVMVVADVVRAVLVAAMALPGEPIVLTVVLLAVVQLLYAPFSSARNAVLPAILSGDRFVAGLALVRTTNQLGMVIGFGAGGVLLTALGTHTTLLIDAATFAVSALLVAFGVRAHHPPSSDGKADGAADGAARAWWTSIRSGFALVSTDRKLRALVALACTSGFYVVPEGIAAPYASQIHGNATAVGLLLAANPIGAVIGMVALQRLRPDWRVRLMGPLAVATCAVLLPTMWAPILAISMLLWIANGLFSAYDMVTNATFVQLTPDASRGQAIGLASAAMQGAQGLGVVLAGLLAQTLAPGTVVGLAAVLGSIAALRAAIAWTRANREASRIAVPGDAGVPRASHS